ncbi:phasin family protein [bacterium]|nr:phasin family protein [bacterium]
MEDSSILKKTMLAGLGIYALTKEKAQELSNDLIKRGELSKDESAKFIKALLAKADEEIDYLKKFVDKQVQQTMAKIRPSYEEEFQALHRKIDKLTKEVEKLRK